MPHPYLIRNRLEDVIYLIQYLGLGESFCLTAANKSMPKPRSAGAWVDVCNDHPEFFGITADKSVYLAIRYFLREARKPDPIPLADVQTLIKNAMDLHERQLQASKTFREWGTLIAASIAAVASVVQIFLDK